MSSVIFGIIALLTVWFLYSFYFKSSNANEVSEEINLLKTPPTVTTIIKPAAVNFTYSLWMYVNQWNNQDSANYKTIFKGSDTGGANHHLKMDGTTPTLIFDVQYAFGANDAPESIPITSAFPLQKWVYVTIVLSGQVIDFYINGKMVKSVQTAAAPTPNVTKIEFGNTLDCYVRKFRRVVEVQSNDQIMADYMAGTGAMGVASATSLEGRVEITRDSQVQGSWKLF